MIYAYKLFFYWPGQKRGRPGTLYITWTSQDITPEDAQRKLNLAIPGAKLKTIRFWPPKKADRKIVWSDKQL